MSFLSKLWKGVKKTVKKIGKGIKKVFKKIGGAIGKLGIVGQIGMMFLMPYATSALGSFFGASGKLATWSSKLLGKAGLGSQALGHGLNLINKAGTFVGNVYNSVSQTIGNAVDRVTNFAKGKGFTLSEGRTSVFAKKTPESLTKTIDAGKTLDVTKATPEEFTKTLMDSKGKVPGVTDVSSLTKTPDLTGFVPEQTVKVGGDLTSFLEQNYKEAITPKIKSSKLSEIVEGVTDVSELTKTVNVPSMLDKTKEAGFLDNINIFDKNSAIRKDIAEMDIYETGKKYAKETVKESLIGGAKAGLTQQAAEAFGYKQEGTNYYSFNIPEMMDAGVSSPSVFNTVDLMSQKQGNSYWTGNIQNSNYLNNLIGEGNSAYDSYMANFAASQYTPMQRGIAQAAGYNI